MESAAATQLASHLTVQRKPLGQQVATRLLRTFPELTHSLRLEEHYTATDRLSQVAVERFSEVVRAILLFDLPALADKEIAWAQGTLPPRGVTYQHQSAMVRWFFEEVRRLALSPAEAALTRELEHYLLNLVSKAYNRN